MKHTFKTFITIISLIFSFSLYAQVDTKGTDFWVAFGQNATRTSSEVSLQIRIVATEATTGTIQFTNIGTSVPFTVLAGGVYTYSLTSAEKAAAYNSSTGISNKTIHIQTEKPVTVYALNDNSGTADATNVLPVTVLGTDYYQISYTISQHAYPDAYAIIATQNNTQVYHNGLLNATLNAGQIYYRTSATDMTGTHITTDKPVAFFAEHQGAHIPYGVPAIDMLFQQLAPVNTWGKNFFVPVSKLGKDIVRIVASQNNTVITQQGGTILSGNLILNAGQYVELMVPLTNNGCYIQADKPVGICVYLTGQDYNGKGTSDPAQAWLPPIEQKVNSALIAPFVPSGSTNLTEHIALIVTPTSTKNNTTVSIGATSGVPLSGGAWYDNAVSGMSFYSMPLTNKTSSYLFANQAGLTVMGYGIGTYESYYYLACSSMRILDAAFYANNIHNQDLASEIICTQPTQFRAEITGAMSTAAGHLKWYIDNVEETAARDQLTWSKTLANGTYQIKMIALSDDDVTTKTVQAAMTVSSSCAGLVTPSCTEICQGAGSVTFTLSSYWGSITKWQYAVSPFSTWIDINETASTLVIENLPETMKVRAVVNSTNYTDPVTITVLPTPVVSFTGATTICPGSTTTLSPATGGTWKSNNTAVATVTNAGVVTGVSSGSVTFTYTRTDGCSASVTP